jgi:hypothetical protein
MSCSAYSLPSYYRPVSKPCELKVPRGVHVIHEGKKKTVCWTHVREFQNKGGIIFKPREIPTRAK